MFSMNKFILTVASMVTLLLVVATYLLFSAFSARILEHAAYDQSAAIARLTFSNMVQLMSLGWKRDQVVSFTGNAARSLTERSVKIDFHRGPIVEARFGKVTQRPADEQMQSAMRSGKPIETRTAQGGRHVYPMIAEERCLACHTNARKGDILGAISVETAFDAELGEARMLMLVIMLLFVPLPMVGAGLVVWFLHSRLERFNTELDAVVGRAVLDKTAPDFSRVRPAFHELDEILDRIKLFASGQRI